ncbi:MAG TPA: glycosyltransferase [Armatimonadota bacterium]
MSAPVPASSAGTAPRPVPPTSGGHAETSSGRGRRIALIAGALSLGGAEKQLLHICHALHQSGVEVTVFSLTRGQHYEALLQDQGIPVRHFGVRGGPPARALLLARELRRLRPEVVHSVHFFTNLYAAAGARACGALSIGSIQSDLAYEMQKSGIWGRSCLHATGRLVVNSQEAYRRALDAGVAPARLRVLPNVLDTVELDARAAQPADLPLPEGGPIAVAVGRLVPVKRFDRFLEALALARERCPTLRGLLIGDGPERTRLEALARELSLGPEALTLAGQRDDVPALLARCRLMVQCSDHEGMPNALLEGMASRLPILTTPAGDSAALVQEDVTGYVVPFDDSEVIADRMVYLADSPARCRAMGEAARQLVLDRFSPNGLAERVLAIYGQVLEGVSG